MANRGGVGLAVALCAASIGCGSEVTTDPVRDYFWTENGGPVSGYAMLADDSRGFRIIVFLEEGGDALVYYEEGILGHGFNRMDDYADTRVRVAGSWAIDDGAVSIGDLATCVFDEESGTEHLACTLTRDVASPGAAGVAVRVFKDQPRDQYGAMPDDPFYDDYAPE